MGKSKWWRRSAVVAVSVAAVVSCTYWTNGLSKSAAGNRVSPNPVLGYDGDVIEVVNDRARLWQVSQGGNNPTDYDIRTLTGCASVNPTLKYSLIWADDYVGAGSRWFFLGVVSTSDTTGTVPGQVCLAVSSGPTFRTSTWKAYFYNTPNAPYCVPQHNTNSVCTGPGTPYGCCTGSGAGSCTCANSTCTSDGGYCSNSAYLQDASLAVDHDYVTVSGVRHNMHSKLDGWCQKWSSDPESYFFLVKKTDLVAWASNPTRYEYVPSQPSNCPFGPYPAGGIAPEMLKPVQSTIGGNNNAQGSITFLMSPVDGQQTVHVTLLKHDSVPPTRFDYYPLMPAGNVWYRTVSDTPQSGGGSEHVDTRGILYSRPHFENAVISDCPTGVSAWGCIYAVATVGNAPSATANDIRYVRLNLPLTGQFAIGETVLKDAGASVTDSVFAPFILPLVGAYGTNVQPGDLLIAAHRVGTNFGLQTVMTGRRAGDTASTLRSWQTIKDQTGTVWGATDQPNPYFFGRTRGIEQQPQESQGADPKYWMTYTTIGGANNSACTGPGTCTTSFCTCCTGANAGTCKDWASEVLTFAYSELPH